jgi:ribose-phosphate pyrophosphokinase
MNQEFLMVSGSANQELALAVARLLHVEPVRCRVERFPDTEINLELLEPVRDRRVFIVQSSSPPVDAHVMEAFAIADACRREGASGITWIAPYFGYARSDKRKGRRTALMGRLVADFAEHAGVDQIIAVDLHSPQVEGFFRIPVDNLSAVPALAGALREQVEAGSVIVSPDTGGTKLASAYGAALGFPVVVLHKERLDGAKSVVTRIAGEVRGKACVIVDDMISTGGTVRKAIEALLHAGAGERVIVAATHPVFTAEARENLDHPAIKQITVADSIPVATDVWPRVKTVSLAPLLAAAIRSHVAAA